MLGDTFTGKTSLVLRFAEGHYRDSARSATVGAFFITKRLTVQGMTCKIQIWDTAGQEQFKKLAPMYYKNAAAAIVCYDINNPKSFETLKYWIDELHQNFPAGGIVVAMCATKCDLTVQPDTSQAEELAQQTGSLFLTTSAKDNTNVTTLFEKVAERVLHFQKQHVGNSNIPVTLGTTSVETPTGNNGIIQAADATATTSPVTPDQPTIGTSSLPPPPEAKSPMDGKRTRKDSDNSEQENDVIDPAESQDSTANVKTRCDTNMLMCGDIVGAGDGAGCIIL